MLHLDFIGSSQEITDFPNALWFAAIFLSQNGLDLQL